MVFVTHRVMLDKKIDDFTYENSPTEVEDVIDVSISDSIGNGKDTFSFKLVNTLLSNGTRKYDNFFNVGDKIIIYRNVNATTATQLYMTGVITSLPLSRNSDSDILSVSGKNFTEVITNAITFVKSTLPLDQYLEQGLAYVNSLNPNLNLVWTAPTTNLNGDPFPDVNERWAYKNFTRMLERFSNKKYTKDGSNYYYYVDNNNNFVWAPRVANPVGSFDTSSTVHSEINVKKDTSKVVNFGLVRSQTTPGGWLTTVRVDDPVSRAKHGFKYKLITSDVVKQLLEEDGVTQGDNDRYPSDFTSTYTTKWKVSKDHNVPENVANDVPEMNEEQFVDCDNKKQYDNAIWLEARFRMRVEGQAYIDEHKNGKLNITVGLVPSDVPYELGGVYNVTVPDVGIVNNPMRVKSRRLGSKIDSFTFEEDEGTV